MKKQITLLTIVLLGILSTTTAQQQGKKANLNEDGTIAVETITLPENYYNPEQTQVFDQLWRFGEPAHPNFKNSRGTTLADIDNDGIDEIIYGIWNALYALEGDGTVLLEKTVSGTILLPPSVADLNNDGTLEIVLN